VIHASTEAEVNSAMEGGGIVLMVADLPLPWNGAANRLADLQREHPEIQVIFRTGSTGNRTIAESVPQTARAVRDALERRPDVQSGEARRAMIERVVHNQSEQLRLVRRDLWDFDDAVKDVTRTAANLLDVARVSLWEVEPASSKLVCVVTYKRETNSHSTEPEIELRPSYFAALEAGMFMAADDAQNDPRTSGLTEGYLSTLGITSMLDAPVRREGRVVGVLCHEHIGPARHWSIVDQSTAAAMAEIVARAMEVRERKFAETRLRDSEKFEVIGRLAGRIAHDFNNLLTVILGNAQLALHRQGVDPAERESLQQIVQAGEDASGLIRQLLSYSRRETVRPRVIDLREQITGHLALLRHLLGNTVALRTELGPSPCWIEIDPTQFQQVLFNLAVNARDAMPQGGEFTLTLVRDEPSGAKGRVRLSARDTGEGIPADVLPHIFEPFFTTKEAKLGTGLGLASVGEIVRRADAKIAVTSSPGRGSTFEIVFPEANPAKAVELAGESDDTPGPLPAERGTVMIVQSDPEQRKALTRMLAERGRHTLEASGPVEALELIARGSKFDWVMTDQVLPKMDGARLIRHLRDFRPNLPAVLIADSARVEPAELDALRRSGKTVVLGKPWTSGELLSSLDSLEATR
jgi:two-component system cell cycle sensor histidine kinase/response regulator CckA